MKSFLLLINLFIVASIAESYELPVACAQSKSHPKDCYKCSEETTDLVKKDPFVDFNNKVSAPFETLALFTEKAKKLRAANLAVKDYLASMFRSLRDKEKEPTFQSGMREIADIQEDFNQLTILSKEANHMQRRLNVCITSCSAGRKLELNDDIERIQKLKSILLIKQPLLANQNFEKLFSDMSDKTIDSDEYFSREIFEKKLNAAIFENLQGILKKEDQYAAFDYDGKKPIIKLSNLDMIKSYNEDLVNRFPLISESIIQDISFNEALKTPPDTSACYLTQQYLSYTSKKKYQEIGLDVTLFVLPFALGPLGRASELGVEMLLARRLASYGLKANEASKMLKVTSISLQSAVVASEVSHIASEIKKCKLREVEFISQANAENLESLQECRKDLSTRILLAELSAIPLVSTSISKRVLALGSVKPQANSGRMSLLLKDFGVGKNKVIKTEIDNILKTVRDDKRAFESLSNAPKNKSSEINDFLKEHQLGSNLKNPVPITALNLADYQKKIGKETIELLYIPGADVPHLPEAIKRVGHVAIRIGDKVYHQTGGSGFKIESFENFLGTTKKNYKVYGQVIKASEKEQKVMESYFQKVHDKQLPYSFLVNNCSQTICRSLGLADIEKMNPVVQLDPYLTQLKMSRNDRVLMKTSYNADKDLSEKALLKATAANRLAFYGIPAAGVATTAGLGVEAVDVVIDYLNQIKETR